MAVTRALLDKNVHKKQYNTGALGAALEAWNSLKRENSQEDAFIASATNKGIRIVYNKKLNYV